MPITDKQKKQFVWAGAALLGVCYFAPSLVNATRHAFSRPDPVIAKPSPVHVAAAPPPPPPAPVSPEDALNAQAAKMAGDWLGAGILQNRGLCRIGLQIRPVPDKPGNYTGYSTTGCNPSLALLGHAATRENMAKDTINAMTPTSVIMSGAAKGGEIVFQISEAIGTPPDGCPVSAFKASPFGEQIAVQWQAEPCKGGQLILNRVTNLR
jgi:hypothetical protein